MKSITSFFLFFCLIVPFFGTFTWLKIEKRNAKKAIKWRMIDGMDKGELVLLKFTKEESGSRLRWEHSREFEYAGQMYDVVEMKETGDTILYWCWWDHEETKLNKQLSSLVANAMSQNPLNKEKQQKLSSFLKNLYCQIKFGNNLFKDLTNRITLTDIHFSFTSIYISPPALPPETV